MPRQLLHPRNDSWSTGHGPQKNLTLTHTRYTGQARLVTTLTQINFSGRDKRHNCHDLKMQKSPETLSCHGFTVKTPRSRGGEKSDHGGTLSTLHSSGTKEGCLILSACFIGSLCPSRSIHHPSYGSYGCLLPTLRPGASENPMFMRALTGLRVRRPIAVSPASCHKMSFGCFPGVAKQTIRTQPAPTGSIRSY